MVSEVFDEAQKYKLIFQKLINERQNRAAIAF
jgi:hypothetical protein